MSFRKRNVPVNRTVPVGPAISGDAPHSASAPVVAVPKEPPNPAIRASPLTSHLTTSTGTATLDKLLGLGAGLALGSSLLVEEDGSTDFASALVRAFAAEGICQRQQVVVVHPKGWSSGLPGIAEEKGRSKRKGVERASGGEGEADRLKIAWRYEKLGNLSAAEMERRGGPSSSSEPMQASSGQDRPFCHTFDQAKRLDPPTQSLPIIHIQPEPPTGSSSTSPYTPILNMLQQLLDPPGGPAIVPHKPSLPVIRLVIPQLLNPLLYPSAASDPTNLISFLHNLRALTRKHTARLVIMVSWPLSLYPRTHILTRYAEQLLDGLLTLHPFPHSFSVDTIEESQGSNSKEDTEKTQGLIRVMKLPVLSERGVSVGSGEDMAFAVSRRRFVVKPFHLPPLLEAENGGGGTDGGEKKEGEGKVDAKKLDF